MIRKNVLKPKKEKRKKVSDRHLLKLWAEKVKERSGYRCEYPCCTVRTSQLHPHHIYSRRHAATRYDPDNGMCLCAHHHTLGSESAHHDPDFKEKIIAGGVRTRVDFDFLRYKKETITKNNQEFKDWWFDFLTTGRARYRPDCKATETACKIAEEVGL